jgi:outer membrane protein with beta-barrel domain
MPFLKVKKLKGRNIEMNRLAVATIFVITLLASFACAQQPAPAVQEPTPKFQVFGGYTLSYIDNGGLSPNALYTGLRQPTSGFEVESNFHGWDAEVQYNVNGWFGIAGEASGRYGNPLVSTKYGNLSGLPKASGYTFVGGPVFILRNKTRFTPFAHALFGVDRSSMTAGTVTGLATPVSTSSTTYSDVAGVMGGGLDIRIARHFALRVPQIDDLYTTHNLNRFYDSVFTSPYFLGLSTHEHSLRISGGIVARF